MTETVTVTCTCCDAVETRDGGSTKPPCQCSPLGCFVSGKCIKHCHANHPECGKLRGHTPGETYYRDTFRYGYARA